MLHASEVNYLCAVRLAATSGPPRCDRETGSSSVELLILLSVALLGFGGFMAFGRSTSDKSAQQAEAIEEINGTLGGGGNRATADSSWAPGDAEEGTSFNAEVARIAREIEVNGGAEGAGAPGGNPPPERSTAANLARNGLALVMSQIPFTAENERFKRRLVHTGWEAVKGVVSLVKVFIPYTDENQVVTQAIYDCALDPLACNQRAGEWMYNTGVALVNHVVDTATGDDPMAMVDLGADIAFEVGTLAVGKVATAGKGARAAAVASRTSNVADDLATVGAIARRADDLPVEVIGYGGRVVDELTPNTKLYRFEPRDANSPMTPHRSPYFTDSRANDYGPNVHGESDALYVVTEDTVETLTELRRKQGYFDDDVVLREITVGELMERYPGGQFLKDHLFDGTVVGSGQANRGAYTFVVRGGNNLDEIFQRRPLGSGSSEAYRFAHDYITQADDFAARGIPVDPNSAAGRYLTDVREVFSDVARYGENDVGRYLTNYEEVAEQLVEVNRRHNSMAVARETSITRAASAPDIAP